MFILPNWIKKAAKVSFVSANSTMHVANSIVHTRACIGETWWGKIASSYATRWCLCCGFLPRK